MSEILNEETQEKIKELKNCYKSIEDSKIINAEDAYTKFTNQTLSIYESFEDPDTIDESEYDKFSLLHIAVLNEDYSAVKYLISKGADINLKDDCKNTPFHLLAKVYSMTKKNEKVLEEIIQLFLDNRVGTQRKNSQGLTPYHLAVENANLIFIKLMIKNNIKMNMTDSKKNNVLHILAKEAIKNEEEKKNINHTIIYKSEGIKYTSEELLEIIEYKEAQFIEIAKKLVEYGLNIEALNEYNETPFEIAGNHSNGTLGLILKGEYDENDIKISINSLTKGKSLHQAISDEDEEAVKALIELGADVNEEGEESPFIEKTPLAIACMKMNLSIIETLLEAKADPNYRTSNREYSVLFWMIKYCRYNDQFYKEKRLEKVLKMLIDAGLDINAPVDNEGNTALGCAYSNARSTLVYFGYGIFNELFVKKYINLGADINIANNQGITPLMQFVINSSFEREDAFLDLLENGAKLSVKDNLGETVLMKAGKNRQHSLMVQMAEIMEEFGDLDIASVNNNSETAMEIAIKNYNESLAQWIAERI